ncbi:glutamate 5-kinase [Saccharomycopsis crataegensis]|uniref:Glutamate 5-kinase n=1 Tax=Saccharomycopsis crataegensis TaxID=43959 RepID=A0AAV5QDW6_9ASCO|nr:glutamate 5-kinase [Saccharomycopsis crataegensis]
MTSDCKTIVVKLGSSSIVDEVTREPRIANMSLIVETLVKLRRQGHRIVIVSSGAIAVGLKRVGLTSKPKQLSKVQALASIGQGRLIALWDDLFKLLDQPIGQILITKNDIAAWNQYRNARNTINELLDMDIIPIVNENDTLSVREIRFGDNDTLSAVTAAMIQADYLFLLTDVDCLYTENPRNNPDAVPILEVKNMNDLQVDTSSGGSDVGTGGMTTKLIAAEIATSGGVTTIVTKSSVPGNIASIVDYIQANESDLQNLSLENDDVQFLDKQKKELEMLVKHDVPLHTRFIGQKENAAKNRELWLLYGLKPYGTIIVDEGASKALTRKNRAGLLPVGIIEVQGSFHEDQCVTLMQGARLPNGELDTSKELIEIGRARVNYTSADLAKIKGLHSNEIEKVLGYADSEYVAHRENLAFPVI